MCREARKAVIKLISIQTILSMVAGIVIGLMIGAYVHDRNSSLYLQKIKELKEYNFQKDRDLDACLDVLEDDEIGLFILGDDCVCENGDTE